ncbi:hypothetical protein [Mesoflavibacter zeaxanthinifaciens]|uniref:hypothetical protein n=1 Tax=Mesoflavibacter zeaxanthinifaciens TaxID=393060 RepID=UPI003A95569E
MNLVEDLQWRYATKKMNGKTIPKKTDYILEAADWRSSSGLQPYKIFVISNKELTKINPLLGTKAQILTLRVRALRRDGYSLERIGSAFNYTLKERNLPSIP